MSPSRTRGLVLVVVVLVGLLAPPMDSPANASPIKQTQVHIDTFADGSEEVVGEVALMDNLVAEISIPAGANVLQGSISVSRVRYDVTDIAMDATPRSMWCGDIDNDGSADDLVVTYPEADKVEVLVLEGVPPRPVVVHTLAVPDPTAVAVADLDRDLDKDLMVTSGDGSSLYIFEGLTRTTFGEPSIIPVGPRPTDVITRDVDRDFRTDVIVANTGGSSLTILQGRGDLTFYPRRVEVGKGPSNVFMRDMDKDLFEDLIVAEARNDSITVLYNEGNGNFSNATTLNTGPGLADIFIRDVNGDSLVDITAIIGSEDTVIVFAQDGDGDFFTYETLPVGRAPRDVIADQMNKPEDNNIDLVVVNSGSDNITIYLAGGDLRHTVPLDIQVGGRPVAVATLDGDNPLGKSLLVLCQMPPSLSIIQPIELADGIKVGFGPGGSQDAQQLERGTDGARLDITDALNNYMLNHRSEVAFGQLTVHIEAKAIETGWLRLSDVEVWVQTNRPPRADAGRNITVEVGEPAELNGSACYDPEGGYLDFKWLLPGDVNPSHTDRVSLHVFNEPGTYFVLLVVVDPWGLQDQDMLEVTVNAPPVARGTVPATVHALEPTRLSAHLSEDADGTIVDYIWDYSQGVVHGRTVDVMFTGEGTWNVTLEVVDDVGARSIATWQVEVLPSRVDLREPAEQIPEDRGEVPAVGAMGWALAMLAAAALAGLSRRRWAA